MKVYKVKVNGKVYEVELESVSESQGSIQTPAQTAPKAAQPVANASGAAYELKAPMAGTILDVKVKVGDAIQEGAVVCILEAMKLENEVVADISGVVKAINVTKGDAVENGKVLVIIG